MALNIGLGAVPGHESSSLQTIQPEGHMWLPCIRAEPGILSIQPAGACFIADESMYCNDRLLFDYSCVAL